MSSYVSIDTGHRRTLAGLFGLSKKPPPSDKAAPPEKAGKTAS
jgi:hypothetical protein